MKTRMCRHFMVVGVACVATLLSSNVMAFSIGLRLHDVLERQSESANPGTGWWSAFQDRFPQARVPNRSAFDAIERPLGDWFDTGRRGVVAQGDVPAPFDIARIGIDRETRLAFFRQRIAQRIMVSRRLNHWLAHQAASNPTPVPLPAPLALLGSALLGLVANGRRAPRGGAELPG